MDYKGSADADLIASVAVLWGRYIQLHTLWSLHPPNLPLTAALKTAPSLPPCSPSNLSLQASVTLKGLHRIALR